MNILIATGNKHKVEEIREILPDFAEYLIDTGAVPDLEDKAGPVEDGKTYEENALIKAIYYHKLTGLPTLADDSGIEIDCFDGQPGIYSARFIDPSLSYAERNALVVERMKDVPDEKRGARFRCCAVFVISKDNVKIEYGTLEGRIAHEPKGEHGFGYDPVFYLPDRKLHLAQVTPEDKNAISHRGRAFAKMEKHLAEFFKENKKQATPHQH